MSKNAVARREDVQAFRGFIESPAVLQELSKALPAGLTPQRMVRQVVTLVQQNPKLLDCTHLSILSGVMQAAEMGLELTGGLGHAYLVPRYDGRAKATVAVFQAGWKGLVKLAFQSGNLTAFPVRTVHANDEFAVALGTENRIHHVPAYGDRGAPVGYYACALYKAGGNDFEYMTREEVAAHRDKYSKAGEYSPWASAFDEMAQKTVVRRLCRRLSLCPQAQSAAGLDEMADHGYYRAQPLPEQSRTGRVAGLLQQQAAEQLVDFPLEEGGDHRPEGSDEQGGV